MTEAQIVQMLLDFIKPALLILVPILWMLGNRLKESKHVEDWKIPFWLMGLAIIFALSYVLITEGVQPMAVWMGIVQGLAIAMLQGYLFNVTKQVTEKRNT